MKALRHLSNVLLAAALVASLGCTSKSPTEPGGTPTTPKPPEPPPTVVTFDVTVTANPQELTVGSGTPSTITVTVRQTSNGQPPPDLTSVALSTNLGTFGSIAGSSETTLQLIGGRAQAVLFAGNSAGTATVRATVGGSSGGANVRISSPGTFSVTGIVPNVGGLQGGETVEITGTGFDAPVTVRIGNAAASVTSVTATRLRVITPTALAATGRTLGAGEQAVTNVEVNINVNESNPQSAVLTNGFTYAAGGGGGQPNIFSLSPTTGSNDGGTRVSIVGEGFAQPLQVLFGLGATADTFNGVEATVQNVTPNQIVVVTPSARGFGQNLVNQLVNVLVKNLSTGASSIRPAAFKYGSNVLITAMGPGSGPFTGGTRVTISGQGFDDPVAVSLGGVGQFVNSVTGSEIVFTTAGILVTSCPASGFVPATGVRVVNIDTGDSDDADITFNYQVPLPHIFGVNPTSGSIGASLTITGVNFAPNVQVLFGDPTNGSSAQVISVTPTTVVVRVPTPAAGFTFNTTPCGTTGTMNVPTPISVTVRNLDGPGCFVTFTNGFLLNPSDVACHGDTPPAAQCSDGLDNDSDGFIDGFDPQCTGPADNDESS
jgi:hypothetical protein